MDGVLRWARGTFRLDRLQSDEARKQPHLMNREQHAAEEIQRITRGNLARLRFPIEPPVDKRVEGAIESVNRAIERFNIIEDEKIAETAHAARAEALVAAELNYLYHEKRHVIEQLVPMRIAQQEARAALNQARRDQQALDQTKDEVQMVREAIRELFEISKRPRPASEPPAQTETDEVVRHLRSSLAAAEKRNAEARRAVKRSKTNAEAAIRKVGRLGLTVQRQAGGLSSCLEQHEEYEELRHALEKVRLQMEERLLALEHDKEVADAVYGSAMDGLETLSNELHDAQRTAADAPHGADG